MLFFYSLSTTVEKEATRRSHRLSAKADLSQTDKNEVTHSSSNSSDLIDTLNVSVVGTIDNTQIPHDSPFPNVNNLELNKLKIVQNRETKLRRAIKKETLAKTRIIEQKNRAINRWRKKYYRLLNSTSQKDEISQEVKQIENKGKSFVRKNLQSFVILKKQLADKKKKLKTVQEKSMFAQVLAGKISNKYRSLKKTTCNDLVSTYYENKYSSSTSLLFERGTRIAKLKDMKKSVRQFLERDDNSVLTPGKKEFIVKNKIRKKKRYLSDTVDNLYGKYTREGLLKMSRASFYRLKPFWIVTKVASSRDTCMCKTHTNMKYLIQKLAHLKIIKYSTPSKFIACIVCRLTDKNCFYNTCSACKNKSLSSTDANEKTWYHKWITREIERPGAKGLIYKVKVTSKEKVDCCITDLIEEFNQELPAYLKHIYDTDHQMQMLLNLKNNLKENEVLVQMDFSQNYVCKYSEAIQSAHFGASQKQVSLHTGVFYFNDSISQKLSCVSFCTVSDCLRHDAAAIWGHLQPVIELIKSHVPSINTLHFQTDGPTTQYKNKFNFYLFRYFCEKLNLDYSSWNFTTPGHGKSSADGVGGTVKSMCDRAVANGVDINSASAVRDFIGSDKNKTKIFLILEEDIKVIDSLLKNDLKGVPNTKQIYQIVWSKTNCKAIYLKSLSCTSCHTIEFHNPFCQHFALNPSTWYLDYNSRSSVEKTVSKKNNRKTKVSNKSLNTAVQSKNNQKNKNKRIVGKKETTSIDKKALKNNDKKPTESVDDKKATKSVLKKVTKGFNKKAKNIVDNVKIVDEKSTEVVNKKSLKSVGKKVG